MRPVYCATQIQNQLIIPHNLVGPNSDSGKDSLGRFWSKLIGSCNNWLDCSGQNAESASARKTRYALIDGTHKPEPVQHFWAICDSGPLNASEGGEIRNCSKVYQPRRHHPCRYLHRWWPGPPWLLPRFEHFHHQSSRPSQHQAHPPSSSSPCQSHSHFVHHGLDGVSGRELP